MNCEEVRIMIDIHLFDRNYQVNEYAQAHIKSCDKCKSYYAEAQLQSKLIRGISETEPFLSDPERLSESIMQSIRDEQANNFLNSGTFKIAYRTLSAAVVLLLLAFGTEQFLILQKVQKLETSLGFESRQQNINYAVQRAALINLSEILAMHKPDTTGTKKPGPFNRNYFKFRNFTFPDIDRYMYKEVTKQSSTFNKIKKRK